MIGVKRADAPGRDILVGLADHVAKLSKPALSPLQGIDRLAKHVAFRLKLPAFHLSPDPLLNVWREMARHK